MVAPEYNMWFLIAGFIILIISSVIQSFWEFGREVRADLRPAVFDKPWRHAILAGWIILLIVSGVLLLFSEPIVAIVAIVVYWLLLPISVGSRVRRRALPPWIDLRGELEKEGYTEHNYWRRGDWWKDESKRSKPKKKSDE